MEGDKAPEFLLPEACENMVGLLEELKKGTVVFDLLSDGFRHHLYPGVH